jgi:membrane dipeptidase
MLLGVRTRKEEENLIARFGDNYRAYMKRTGRFLPGRLFLEVWLMLAAAGIGASSCSSPADVPPATEAVAPVAVPPQALAPGLDVSPQAAQVHMNAIVVDGHSDTPQRLIFEAGFDLGARHEDGSIDIPRMREGGLDAVFFSIWLPSTVTGPPAVKRALDLIDGVRESVRLHAQDLILATTAADIRRASGERKIAALMGIEGGHMIDDDLRVLRSYAALGARYMTLTHSRNNNWADASTDKPAHNGLTDFGKDVVREMNRLGMIVDISHVSEKTFFDAIELSKAPVIASHSSCRAISNHARNMTDDQLQALAKNGGVMMVNYELGFLSEEYRLAGQAPDVAAQRGEIDKKCGGNDACSILMTGRLNHELMNSGKLPRVTSEKIIEHIDHAVKVAGVDHVGLGSDFDGATMPIGMEDASKLPRITDALLKKGYSEQDVAKILGGNLLRVMEQVESVSQGGIQSK